MTATDTAVIMRSPDHSLRKHIAGPSAWTGADMRTREAAWSCRLSPAEVAEIEIATRAVQARGLGLAAIRRVDFPLPTLGPVLDCCSRRLTEVDFEALDMLGALAADPELRLEMNFMPGDIQLLHNHTIPHARSGYKDWPDEARKRHLLRLWLAPPEARALPPVFAECYGGLTAGDRGGIICEGTRLHAPLTPG